MLAMSNAKHSNNRWKCNCGIKLSEVDRAYSGDISILDVHLSKSESGFRILGT